MDISHQHRVVQEQFTKQSARWGEMAVPQDLQDVLMRIDVAPDARVLDVACGTGLLARALSVRAREIVAVDITPAMLARGREAAEREGITNVEFVEAPAEALPFADSSFDLVVTRFSLHHIAEPQRVVDEMLRVAHNRGRVAIIDLLAPDDAALALRQNEIENLRDPSHTKTLRWGELRELVEEAGATIVDEFTVEEERELDAWIALAGKEKEPELRAFFEEELRGGAPTGFRPFRRGEAVFFEHPWGVIVARA